MCIHLIIICHLWLLLGHLLCPLHCLGTTTTVQSMLPIVTVGGLIVFSINFLFPSRRSALLSVPVFWCSVTRGLCPTVGHTILVDYLPWLYKRVPCRLPSSRLPIALLLIIISFLLKIWFNRKICSYCVWLVLWEKWLFSVGSSSGSPSRRSSLVARAAKLSKATAIDAVLVIVAVSNINRCRFKVK